MEHFVYIGFAKGSCLCFAVLSLCELFDIEDWLEWNIWSTSLVLQPKNGLNSSACFYDSGQLVWAALETVLPERLCLRELTRLVDNTGGQEG